MKSDTYIKMDLSCLAVEASPASAGRGTECLLERSGKISLACTKISWLKPFRLLVYNRINRSNMKVKDSFRTNPLSHKTGGWTIELTYVNNTTRIYDKVHWVDAYLRKAFEDHEIKEARIIGSDRPAITNWNTDLNSSLYEKKQK